MLLSITSGMTLKLPKSLTKYKILAMSFMMVFTFLIASVFSNSVRAQWVEVYQIDSQFVSFETETEWTTATADEDYPVTMNGALVTKGQSGIYMTAAWLPSNYSVQVIFMVPSVYGTYTPGAASYLFLVAEDSPYTSDREVDMTISGMSPVYFYSNGLSHTLSVDTVYYANGTVVDDTLIYCSLYCPSTGVTWVVNDYYDYVGSNIVPKNDQRIYVGSHNMFNEQYGTYARNLYIYNLQVWYMENQTGTNDPDKTAWTDESTNVETVTQLMVFFLPVMIITGLFGRLGFVAGTSIMSIIWMLSDSSFIWAGVLMIGSVGVFIVRGGMR
jgi:hypothetical protein